MKKKCCQPKVHPLDALFRGKKPRINTQQNAAVSPGVAQLMRKLKRG